MKLKHNQAGFAHGIEIAVIVGVCSLIFISVGYVLWQKQLSKNTSSNSSSPNSQESKKTTANVQPAGPLVPQKIEEIAKAEKPNTTLVTMELIQRDGKQVYKLTMSDGTVLYYDAVTATKLASETASSSSTTDGLISSAEALKTAMAQKAGTDLRKLELVNKSGTWTYVATYGDGSVVNINAKTKTSDAPKPADIHAVCQSSPAQETAVCDKPPQVNVFQQGDPNYKPGGI